MQLERIANVKMIFAIRGGNVNINIEEKFSWVNKNAVPIKFRMFIVQSIFLA